MRWRLLLILGLVLTFGVPLVQMMLNVPYGLPDPEYPRSYAEHHPLRWLALRMIWWLGVLAVVAGGLMTRRAGRGGPEA